MKDLIVLFLTGALLCNALPHLAAGTRGERFPTPFAKPRGKGLSPPLVNFFWGFANLATGLFLLKRHFGALGQAADLAALAAGFVLLGVYVSIHFGKVRAASA
jgi:hypothetical protein